MAGTVSRAHNPAANYGRFGNADHMGYVLNQQLAAEWQAMRQAQKEAKQFKELGNNYLTLDCLDHAAIRKVVVRTLCRIRRAGRLGR